MTDAPRAAAPRMRHETPIMFGIASVAAAVTAVAFDEWLYGWVAGLFLGLGGSRAVARRRPDLADPRPAPRPEPWQQVTTAILVIAVVVAVVAVLTRD